jgi:hypothetical protein
MFSYPSTGGSAAILRILFKSKPLEKRLLAHRTNQIIEQREKQLADLLETGTLGKGRNITEDR